MEREQIWARVADIVACYQFSYPIDLAEIDDVRGGIERLLGSDYEVTAHALFGAARVRFTIYPSKGWKPLFTCYASRAVRQLPKRVPIKGIPVKDPDEQPSLHGRDDQERDADRPEPDPEVGEG